jgi:hypothetical protein
VEAAMGFIKLDRFGDPRGSEFDAAAVVEAARGTFTDVRVLPGDQLALSAEQAAVSGAPDHVVRALQRNQREYGPAYSFEIIVDGGRIIQGRARRYDVTFLFADPLPHELRERLLAFLRTLGEGRVEESQERIAKRA